jgi:transposase InsO family protein
MDETKREEVALFRYSVIVPFLSRGELERGVKGEMQRRIAAGTHQIPHSQKRTIGEDSIRKWLAAYKQKGFDGLKPKSRCDARQSRAIPTEIWEMAVKLRCEAPQRSVAKIIRIMELSGLIKPGQVKRPTLSAQFKAHGYNRQNLLDKPIIHRRFEAERPNQIWQSDILYGPYLPDPRQPEKRKRTYLIAFIDDFSRLVPHAEFYWDEKFPTLENTLKKAILRRGRPEIIYVDNGAVYSAHKLDAICASLGIRKISCKPYSPQGKGKIERFFRTVREDFLSEPEIKPVETLADLNKLFWAWLEVSYHQQIHNTTKQEPQNRWQDHIGQYLHLVDEQELLEVFLFQVTRTVTKVGLVMVEGIEFEVDGLLAKKKVQARYNPFDLSWIKVYQKDNFIGKFYPLKLSRWNTARRQKAQKTDSAKVEPSGLKPMAQLAEKHHQQKKKALAELTGQQRLTVKKAMTISALIKSLATSLNKPPESFHPEEIEHLKQLLENLPDLSATIVGLAVSKAVLLHGQQKHISIYVQAIRNQHLNMNLED